MRLTTSSAATFGQKQHVTIPGQTKVKISEFYVSHGRQISCELAKYPKTREIKTVQFDKLNSPFRFYNLISYTVKGEAKGIENRFFVHELTNLSDRDALTINDRSHCGRKLDVPQRVLKDVASDRFYVKYMRGQ